MNKIYVLKKNHRGEIVAVSEVVKNIKRKKHFDISFEVKITHIIIDKHNGGRIQLSIVCFRR